MVSPYIRKITDLAKEVIVKYNLPPKVKKRYIDYAIGVGLKVFYTSSFVNDDELKQICCRYMKKYQTIYDLDLNILIEITSKIIQYFKSLEYDPLFNSYKRVKKLIKELRLDSSKSSYCIALLNSIFNCLFSYKGDYIDICIETKKRYYINNYGMPEDLVDIIISIVSEEIDKWLDIKEREKKEKENK